MRPIKFAAVFLMMALAVMVYPAAYAKCVLPLPDTGEKVSARNLAGYLIEIKGNDAFIKEYKDGKLVRVDVSEIKTAYAAFDYDAKLSELTPGIQVKIWYKNCGKPVADPPKAAYFEFFSNSIEADAELSDSYFNAKCMLPVPDAGGGAEIAPRNLAGYLVRIKSHNAFIKEYKSGKAVKVDISEAEAPYSAFGGDGKFSELVPGIPVRIWYKNCGRPATHPPKAAYFEFFANDIEDKPPASYLTTKRR